MTSFLERERRRLTEGRDRLFKDPGDGLFFGKPRDFVLSQAAANLWEGIRTDAIAYFARNKIPWWQGESGDPTGHLLSSQVSCVNHLYLLRQRKDLASAVLKAIDTDVSEATIVDDGFVEFEFIGTHPYLGEKAFTRGANCTSVDAFMIGHLGSGQLRGFLIEWKYTESYKWGDDKYIPQRWRVYDHLILDEDSPFERIEPRTLYFEPFYQLMRQTLLGWRISAHEDHGCSSYRHIHVVPENNTDFHRNVTSPCLKGNTVAEAWRGVLRQPKLYIDTTPAEFMRPVLEAKDTQSLTGYLECRYWAGS